MICTVWIVSIRTSRDKAVIDVSMFDLNMSRRLYFHGAEKRSLCNCPIDSPSKWASKAEF